jgi:hypothetical protein
MTLTPVRADNPGQTLAELAAEIRATHRALIRELRIEPVAGGVIIRGRASTYYGKQVAFHEVRRRCGRAVVGNQVCVG